MRVLEVRDEKSPANSILIKTIYLTSRISYFNEMEPFIVRFESETENIIKAILKDGIQIYEREPTEIERVLYSE